MGLIVAIYKRLEIPRIQVFRFLSSRASLARSQSPILELFLPSMPFECYSICLETWTLWVVLVFGCPALSLFAVPAFCNSSVQFKLYIY